MPAHIDRTRRALHQSPYLRPNGRDHVYDTPRLGDNVDQSRLCCTIPLERIGYGHRVGRGELAGRGGRGGGGGDGGDDVGEAGDDGLFVLVIELVSKWSPSRGGGAGWHTAHGPAPRNIRGAFRTLSWLAGALRA